MQYMHRDAAIGIVLRHSGQSLVVTSACLANRAVILAIGATIRKYTIAAMIRNASSALMSKPMWKVLPCTLKDTLEKSG